MQLSRIVVLLLLTLVTAPALADEPGKTDPFAQIDPQVFLEGVVTERDVSLLFDHLRLSLAAAAAGREPPSAPELEHRAAEIGEQLRSRSAAFGLLMLDALEARANEALRSRPRPEIRPPDGTQGI